MRDTEILADIKYSILMLATTDNICLLLKLDHHGIHSRAYCRLTKEISPLTANAIAHEETGKEKKPGFVFSKHFHLVGNLCRVIVLLEDFYRFAHENLVGLSQYL
jgi:hypothetical protein